MWYDVDVQFLNMCMQRGGKMMKTKNWNTGQHARNEPIRGGRFEHGISALIYTSMLTYLDSPFE